MIRKMQLHKMLLATGLAVTASTAFSYEAGTFLVRGGAAMVDPDTSSSTLRLDGASLAGTGATVDDNTQLGLAFAYMVTDHIGVELLAATPFTHDVVATGLTNVSPALPDSLTVAEVKHLPPTLSVQYYPMENTSKFQPYAGIGINYTFFFDESVTDAAKTNLTANSIDLDASVGLALQLGCDYSLSDNLFLNAAIWKIDLETTAEIGTSLATPGTVSVDVDVDPWVYMVGVGYQF